MNWLKLVGLSTPPAWSGAPMLVQEHAHAIQQVTPGVRVTQAPGPVQLSQCASLVRRPFMASSCSARGP